jgi:RimJ/RimL family protein N-acetyltransferase
MLAYEGSSPMKKCSNAGQPTREIYIRRLWLMGGHIKETNKMIGQCGLSMQDANGKKVLEIGYLLNRAYWHKEYASEAAIACKDMLLPN